MKLDRDTQKDIREMYNEGMDIKDIAKEYGVNRRVIESILFEKQAKKYNRTVKEW